MGKQTLDLPHRGLCAHRGAMDTHPENTLAAFREAIRLGAHMIEFDVQFTRDSALVIMHDGTVGRTSDGAGKVSELTLAEIRRLDAGGWKSRQFREERIPTLQETLAIMPVNMWLNVHLKGGAEMGRGVARVIVEEDRRHQAFLACRTDAAEAARKVDPGIMICNMERQGMSREYVEETIAMKAAFIQLLGPIVPEIREYARRLKDGGVRINFFGTDSPEELRRLFELGVQFPLVNNVGALMPVAESRGISPLSLEFRPPRD